MQFSSKEPFNDDPKPYVTYADDRRTDIRSKEWDIQSEGATEYVRVFDPRPEYTVIPNNPTNPILSEFRRLVGETSNGLYVTAWLFAGDLLEEWESHPLEQWHHAMDVLEKILSIYKEPKE